MKGNCGECDRRWACDIDPGKCDEWPDPVPVTNADKIRDMSDEEMEVFLLSQADLCSKCQQTGEFCTGYPSCNNERCVNAVKKWLQQPAEGERQWQMK